MNRITRSTGITMGGLAALAGLLLAYQNCARVKLSAGQGSSNSVSCLPTGSPGLAPQLKYTWSLTPNSSDPLSIYNQVMSAPVVGDIDGDGTPEILVTSFSGADNASYGKPGVLRILDGKTGALKASVNQASISPIGYTSPLITDLQGDGHKQIIYTTDNTNVVALNADLSVRWSLALPTPIGVFGCMGGFAAADLDGNGHAEVIADRYVIQENAAHQPSIRFAMAQGASCTTFATSLDPNKPTQMQVVGGDGVYGPTGTKLFSYAPGSQSFAQGFLAAADINPNHPGQEIAITTDGKVALFDGTTGALIWESAVDPSHTCANGSTSGSVGHGGPANIGDFRGDGQLEIGVASGKYYSVYDQDGKLVWDYVTRDCSSAITGATLFDFDGDGKPEIIYGDEHFLRIFQAATGKVLYQLPNSSATLLEYPVVADVDADGHSELVVVGNNIFNDLAGFFSDTTSADEVAIRAVPPGVRVFSASSTSAWVPTRRVWNQYANFVYNVTDQLQATSSTPTLKAAGASLFRQNLLTQFKDVCR